MSKEHISIDTNLLQLVSFKIGEEEFGIDILAVQEIIKMQEISKMPNTPDYVEGIVNLRERVIPIIDLRKRLNFNSKMADKDTRIIVVDVKGTIIGFIVDEVSEVLRISSDITEPPPEMTTNVNTNFITAVGKLEDRLLILLDINKILSNEEVDSITQHMDH